MSEQVIIDREAPPWAQRLQTDINTLLTRLDRRVKTVDATLLEGTTSLQSQIDDLAGNTSWTLSDSFSITTPHSSVDFNVPAEARHVRVYGSVRTATSHDFLGFRISLDGVTFVSGAADYHRVYSGVYNGVASVGSVNSSSAYVCEGSRNDFYGWFDFTIIRGVPGTSWLKWQGTTAAFHGVSGPSQYDVSGYSDGSPTCRFFRFLLGSGGNIDNMRFCVEYQT